MAGTLRREKEPQWDWSISHKEGLEKLLETGYASDLTLILTAEDKKEEVKVHKIFLQSRSKVLAIKIMGCSRLNNRLILENIEDINVFRMMLKYFYTGSSGATIIRALPLLKLAEDFEVKELKDQCVSIILKGEITDDNVLSIFQAAMKYGHEELRVSTLKYICTHARRIMKMPELVSLPENCLIEIIQQDNLRTKDETQIFEAVYKWGKSESKRLGLDSSNTASMRKITGNLLKHIRFPLMNKDSFALHVNPKNLLNTEETMNILLNLLVSQGKRSNVQCNQFSSKPRKYLQNIVAHREIRNPKDLCLVEVDETSSGIRPSESICLTIKGQDALQLKELVIPEHVFSLPHFWKQPCGFQHVANVARDYRLIFHLKIKVSGKSWKIISEDRILPLYKSDGSYRATFKSPPTLNPNIKYKMTMQFVGSSFCNRMQNLYENCPYTSMEYHARPITNFQDSSEATTLDQGRNEIDIGLQFHIEREEAHPFPITSGFIQGFVFDFIDDE